jgi:hypothetical protein
MSTHTSVLAVLGRLVMVLFSVPFLLFGIWAAIFGAPFPALFALALGIALLPFGLFSKTIRTLRLLGIPIVVVIAIATAPLSIEQLNQRISGLDRKASSGFSLRDKLGVWGLNVFMGTLGYGAFPEAATETLQLILPHQPDDVLVFESEFPLNSGRIRERLRDFNRTLAQRSGQQASLDPEVITLGMTNRSISKLLQNYWDIRCALALQPVTLTASATRDDKRWRIDVRCTVPVKYAAEA